MNRPRRHDTLANQLVQLIRDEIAQGVLPPGQLVSAVQLAERFEVSRTPIRDALLQLEQAGMVRIEKNRGVRILATTVDDLIDVFQVRLMLEVPLVASVATFATDLDILGIKETFSRMQAAADIDSEDELLRLDRDFHLQLLGCSGNKRAIRILRDLRNLVLTRGVGTVPLARSYQDLVDDHKNLVDCLVNRDGSGASRAMREHIINTGVLLIVQEADGDARYTQESVRTLLEGVIHAGAIH